MNLDRIIAVRNDKTVYRNLDRCLKIFDADYSKADVLSEALNNARAEETGLPVPKLLEVTMFKGKWVIVYEYISGKTLKQLMSEAPRKKQEYLGLLVSVQNEIHSAAAPRLVSLEDRLRRRLGLSDIPDALRQELLGRLGALASAGYPRRLCHCDCMPSNIILSGGVKPYIIDWPHASIGDPAADAALSRLRFISDGDRDTAEEYTALFCEKSGISVRRIAEWQPIAAAALMADANADKRKLLRGCIE